MMTCVRTGVGPYFGYQFAQKERYNLMAELGLLWANEDFKIGPDTSYRAPAWHLEFDRYLQGSSLQIYHNQDGSVRTGSGRILLDSATGFRMPIVNGFLASMEFEL